MVDSDKISKAFKCKLDMYNVIGKAYKGGVNFDKAGEHGGAGHWKGLQQFEDFQKAVGVDCHKNITLESGAGGTYNNKLGLDDPHFADGAKDPNNKEHLPWEQLSANFNKYKVFRESTYQMGQGFKCLADLFKQVQKVMDATARGKEGIDPAWYGDEHGVQAHPEKIEEIGKVMATPACRAGQILNADQNAFDEKVKKGSIDPIFKVLHEVKKLVDEGKNMGGAPYKENLDKIKEAVQTDLKGKLKEAVEAKGAEYDDSFFLVKWAKNGKQAKYAEGAFKLPTRSQHFGPLLTGPNRTHACCCHNGKAGGCAEKGDCDEAKEHTAEGKCS